MLAKNSWKTEIELFPLSVISQKNYSLSEIFWPGFIIKDDTFDFFFYIDIIHYTLFSYKLLVIT